MSDDEPSQARLPIGPVRPTYHFIEAMGEGWTDAGQRQRVLDGHRPPVESFDGLHHPLLQKARDQFPIDEDLEVERETISAAPRTFYKVKIGRWRGAVWIDPTGQGWLVGGGLRRKGELNDFYEEFARDSNADMEALLPGPLDAARQRLEAAGAQLRQWEVGVRLCVIDAFGEAVTFGSASRSLPNPMPDEPSPACITISIERISDAVDLATAHEEPAGVAVAVKITRWADAEAAAVAKVVACSVIAPCEEEWDISYTEDEGELLTALVTEARLAQLADASALPPAEMEVAIPASGVKPVTMAHIARAPAIAGASVDGTAISGLCGQYFVPRQDPVDFPICPECVDVRDLLLAVAST